MSNPDWAQGYVTDTTYADKFFRELSPAWLNYVAALNGVKPRNLDHAFSYLELGCGFGTSAIVNAGAFPEGEFHACDFNPAHIAGGKRHAEAFGVSNIQFYQASFQELLSRELPQFDFIVLHGVYSWVGSEVRQAIRRIIYERLKPSGLVYVSYNCLPGWAIEAPARKLLVELVAAENGDTRQRTEHALRLLKQLSDSKLRYFNANPAAVAAVDSYIRGPSNYLVHEFLNQSWEPFYSIDIADEMAEAEISYIGSATLPDNHQALILHERAAEAVAQLSTGRQRQLAIDFAVDRRFRRDVFVRGATSQDHADVARYLNAAIIGCLENPERISAKATVPRGAITFQADFIRDLQRLMMRGSMTIGDAVAALAGEGKDTSEITRNLIFLVAAGTLMPFAKAYRPSDAMKTQRPANKIAERMLAYIIEHRTQRVIPSEITGNGVTISPIEALAITEWLAGANTVEMLAARLEAGIRQLNLKSIVEGRELQSSGELAGYARAAAQNAMDNLLPNMTRLGLIV